MQKNWKLQDLSDMMHWDWGNHCLSILIALQLYMAHFHILLVMEPSQTLSKTSLFYSTSHFHMNLTCFFQLAEGWFALGLEADLHRREQQLNLHNWGSLQAFLPTSGVGDLDSSFASSAEHDPTTWRVKKCKRWAKLRNGGHPSWSEFWWKASMQGFSTELQNFRHLKRTVTQAPWGKWTVKHHHITSCSSSLGSSKQPKS